MEPAGTDKKGENAGKKKCRHGHREGNGVASSQVVELSRGRYSGQDPDREPAHDEAHDLAEVALAEAPAHDDGQQDRVSTHAQTKGQSVQPEKMRFPDVQTNADEEEDRGAESQKNRGTG